MNVSKLHTSWPIIQTGKLTTCFNFSLVLIATAISYYCDSCPNERKYKGWVNCHGQKLHKSKRWGYIEQQSTETPGHFMVLASIGTGGLQLLLQVRGRTLLYTWLHLPGTKSGGCTSFEKSFSPPYHSYTDFFRSATVTMVTVSLSRSSCFVPLAIKAAAKQQRWACYWHGHW